MKTYDKTRHKSVTETPEERVRQALVHWLCDVKKVPLHLIATEWSLRHCRPGEKGRVDLVVHRLAHSGASLQKPWLLAECKAEGRGDWESLKIQMTRYLRCLSPNFLILQIGRERRCFRLDFSGSEVIILPIADIPEYLESRDDVE